MDILQNELIQQALVAVFLILLTGLGKWLKAKFSNTEIVNDLWCYVQPAVELAMGNAAKAVAEGSLSGETAKRIVEESVAEFIKGFSKFEGSEPSAKQVAAVMAEITRAIGASVK